MTSASDNRLTVVRKSKHYPVLWKTFISAIRFLAVATIVAIAGLLIDREASPVPVVMYIVTLVSVIAVFRLMRCVWVLEQIVTLVSRPE
jgi:dipeptide/tripeptide permease